MINNKKILQIETAKKIIKKDIENFNNQICVSQRNLDNQ
jgi:hypothetical protein